MRKIMLRLLFAVLAFGLLLFVVKPSWRPFLPGYHSIFYTADAYDSLKHELQEQRVSLGSRYKRAKSPQERKALHEQARHLFIRSIDGAIFPYWYGTRWSFHGTSQIPGQGSIACGYFVTTVLRDAGVQLKRVGLARVASEQMIRALVEERNIERFSDVSIEHFVNTLRGYERRGMYIVGLDRHTGFLHVEDGRVSFIHSSGALPFAVIREEAMQSSVLRRSRYRVLGRLSDDASFINDWLSN